MKNSNLIKIGSLVFALASIFLIQFGRASETENFIRDRKQYEKSIRMRMPPQILIDSIQKELQARSPQLMTFWQSFAVEDDENKDEFVIIARTVEKKWAFGLVKEDCPKPENYEALKNDLAGGGTPVRIDFLIGVKRKRSWFRYIVNIYDPIYVYWKNPCYIWNLSPGKSQDAFYNKNYTMQVYADNLKKQVYAIVKNMSGWKPPKQAKKIPAMKGAGQEFIGGNAEDLTDEEMALPLDKQQAILEKKRKK